MTDPMRIKFCRLARWLVWLSVWAPPFIRAADAPTPFGVGSSAQASGLYASWMPKMAAAGVKWVRVFPSWEQIQPAPGTWNWSLMDSMLNSAASNRLNISGLFLYNAKWVNTNTHTFPTNNYPAWAAYVSNVVRHAAGRVRYWEVWNEPQNFAAGGTPAEYARVVTNAYLAAKAADPEAQIGLSVASVDIVYLEQALQAGAADHFDYLCVHPYEVLGTLRSGQEALFLSIVPTLRKMLAARNPAKWKVPIWFTEIGQELGGQVTPTTQAQELVKAYTLGIAQGVSCIQWFEAQEGGYAMGLLDSGGRPTPAYAALSNLAVHLGPNPAYRGWLLLDDRNYGFVFQGAGNTVMAAWAPPQTTNLVSFGEPVAVLDPVGGRLTQSATYSLSNAPVLVIGVPPALVAQAETNRLRPFPWGGDYSGASAVSVTLGAPNLEAGLHQLNADATSTPVTVFGVSARDCSKGSAVAFTVDPNFLSYTRAPIKISAVVRKISAADNPGFNLKYESVTGRKGIGWNAVPGSDKWYTLSWVIVDDQFVGNWGYHFSFDSDSTNYSRYYLQQVTVTNLVPRPTSPPTGLIGVPGPGLAALNWNSVAGATGYHVKRASLSRGPYELIAPTVTGTSYTDAGLFPGAPYYYVVSALNSGGAGPDSEEVAVVPHPPALSILRFGETVQLRWPTSAVGFALQETAVLPANWASSPATAQLEHTNHLVVAPLGDSSKFYRLVR
ncbi:MAG TPA: hypothetical protein P5233_07040 [Candidatus Paceibacterota bacterium]|nr:hypothetical protein [Candidatus Paceibacterota bacterium]